MNSSRFLRLVTLLPVLAGAFPTLAADSPVYVPPDVDGKPDRLVGGASRSSAAMPRLSVLSPPTMGITSSPQPVLYWSAPQDIDTPVSIVIVGFLDRANNRPPLLDIELPKVRAGTHRIALKEHQIALKPGTKYDWTIRFNWTPPGGSQSSGNAQPQPVMSRATLFYQPAPPDLAAQAEQAEPDELPAIYAQAGYWYDSLAALQALLEQHPGDPRYREWRSALFEQVALE